MRLMVSGHREQSSKLKITEVTLRHKGYKSHVYVISPVSILFNVKYSHQFLLDGRNSCQYYPGLTRSRVALLLLQIQTIRVLTQ